MQDPLVYELEMMAYFLERYGKKDEARYIREVIQEYSIEQEQLETQRDLTEGVAKQA